MRFIQDTGRDPRGKLENLEMSDNEIDKSLGFGQAPQSIGVWDRNSHRLLRWLNRSKPLAWIPIKGKPANIQGRILGEKPGVFAFSCWIWLCSRAS